ncbi:site-specific integrase [Vibrio parahaemolyticus]|nr:site-specific integrase [Vibrio parahaemolyticus]HCG8023156.1 site-specific integrase [Vibrio parahaemolyticus]
MRNLTKRNTTFYYQRRIPSHLQQHYKNEKRIRFSLHTTNLREATILATKHTANYDREFFQLQYITLSQTPVGTDQFLAEKPQLNPKQQPKRKDSKLSDCIELFMAAKTVDRVSAKALARYRSRLELLLRIVKNKGINSFTRDDALSFKHQLVQLPPNINNNPRYKGKTIKQIIAFGDNPIGIHTINDTLKVVSGFFDWLVLNEKSDKNPFTKLQVRKEIKASEERKVFTRSDIKKLFNIEPYKTTPKEAWHYWIPLLGLYTGARINELCQLYTDNIKQIDGVWCISINADRPDQKLKTKAAFRNIPIHSKLIKLGFIDYVKSLPLGLVFPTLKYIPEDGYGKYPSKWFSIQRDKALNKDERYKKTFHSFRHTVANELKQMGVEYSPASYLLGHTDETMTYGRYGKDYKPKLLKEVIEKLNFDIHISLLVEIP